MDLLAHFDEIVYGRVVVGVGAAVVLVELGLLIVGPAAGCGRRWPYRCT